MEEDSSVVATYMFRGIEYVVTMNTQGGSSLTVEVEDRLTADQWRGTFDAAYLEDLTHKTGNYKQFPIFVSMLESALTQNSDSVGLDLLTYADLESLKQHKAGVGSSTVQSLRSPTVQSKRYLILTYSVEFDRIHYPLPLPYMGKPEPRALQETIRQLRLEIRKLKQKGTKDFKTKELEKLKKDYARLQEEKEDLETEFAEYQREIEHTGKGSTVQQLRLLKGMVSTLEEELVVQRAKHARQSSSRRQEYNNLLREVEDLRASERNLRVRVKSLTNELAVYKRRRDHGVISSSRSRSRDRDVINTSSGQRKNTSVRSHNRLNNSNVSQRNLSNLSNHSSHRRSQVPSSRESSFNTDRSRLSSRSQDRSYGRNRSLSSDRSLSRDRTGNKSWMSDRSRVSVRDRSRDRSAERGPRLGLNTRSRSPSPAGARYPRFDPTSYIKEKERQKRESSMKHRRHVRQQLRSSGDHLAKSSPATSDRNTGHLRTHSRSSSVGSLRSRTSSVESLSDIGMTSDSSGTKRAGRALNTRKMNAWTDSSLKNGIPHGLSKSGKIMSSTPERDGRSRRRGPDKENEVPLNGMADSDYFDRSAEISEIDARLNRLQQFMKATVK